jgi:hypothetical protein
MNQNQEELFQYLFACRVELQDEYENESDIIKGLKNELIEQGFSLPNIPNTLQEFYKTYGIEIPLDTIVQACNNNIVNSVLGFMLSPGDFEHPNEQEYEYEHHDDDDVNDNDDDDNDDDDNNDDDDVNYNNSQMFNSNQLLNLLAQAILQHPNGQHPNSQPFNSILQHLNNINVPNNSNIQPEPVSNQPEPVSNQHEPVSNQHEPVSNQPEPVSNQHEPNQVLSDISGNSDSNNNSSLQQLASDMLIMNNQFNIHQLMNQHMMQFSSFGPVSINSSVSINGSVQPAIVSPNGSAQNPLLNGSAQNHWLNGESINHSSIVNILNNLGSMLNGPAVPILINGNLNMVNQFQTGNQFQNVVVSMDEKDIENLPSIKLESTQETNCCICMDCMEEGKMITKLDCSHTFHTDCIKEYLKKYNYKCPVCRVELGKAKYNL